jgi:peptide/nickel transport system permease protein
MGLRRYIARRAVYTLILLVVIVVFNFFLFQILPFITSCPGLTPNQCAELLYVPPVPTHGQNSSAILLHERAQVIKQFGFDQPMWTRFGLYFVNMFTGQFGFNLGGLLGGPVWQTITQRLPFTLLLLGAATVAGFALGIGIGVIAAAKRGKVVDVVSLASLLFINALPVFFLGGVLIVAQILLVGRAYVNVGTLLITKQGWATVVPIFQALWLPFVTLTLADIGSVFLTMRATMIDAVAEDYVVMARAKGLTERTVLYKHAFRNAVIPIATTFALAIGFILGGAVITETVFSWPGLGLAIYQGVISNDFPLEQAIFFLISTMVLIAVFAVDIIYGLLDPRIRTG